MSAAHGEEVANPFDSDPVARRYVAGRPYYHRAALERAGIGAVGVALDIGCGTGLSSRAVREYAERVVALDASMAMLAAAETLPRVSYLAAGAEQIPLGDASVDLVTVGAAFHWFDQARVFAELARVMRTGAALVVYSDYFQGRLHERPSFTDWMRDSYLPQYPGPARHAYFDSEAGQAAGFSAAQYAESEIRVSLTGPQLADYLLSQSNAAAAIESGRIGAQALREQIREQTRKFFPGDEPAEAIYGIRVWVSAKQ